MVKNLRAECGHALSVAQGVNQFETLKYLLARTQEELWTAFVWPDLKLRAAIVLAAGQYSYPYHADMPYDCIREAWTAPAESRADTHWTSLEYGIDEDMILPDGTNSERADPVQYWDVDDADDVSASGRRRTPRPGCASTARSSSRRSSPTADVSTLDATAIVLFTAADLLARAKAEDAADQDAEGAAAPAQTARQQDHRRR